MGRSRVRASLASGGVRTPERLADLHAEMRDLFGAARRILFVPWALADHAQYLRAMRERGFSGGYELVGLHEAADPLRAIAEAEGVYVGGGNSFRLLDAMQRSGALDALRRRALAGLPYLGVSAGSNLACPTIRTTNDMPIVEPPHGLGALGLIPFQINPHYFSGGVWLRGAGGEFLPHFGETRDERLAEYHECNATAVLGLHEGAILRVRGPEARLVAGTARWFRPGAQPLDVQAPAAVPAVTPAD